LPKRVDDGQLFKQVAEILLAHPGWELNLPRVKLGLEHGFELATKLDH
jgi:hypothetical protein